MLRTHRSMCDQHFSTPRIRMFRMLSQLVVVAAAIGLLNTNSAHAQNWANYAGGTWNSAANWFPPGVPAFSPTTALFFGSTGFDLGNPPLNYQPDARYTATNDIAGGAVINALIFNGNGANNSGSNGIVMAVSSVAGNTFNFQGTSPSVFQNGTGSVTFSANTTATQEITINSGLNVNGSGSGHVTFAGTIGGAGNLVVQSLGASPMSSGQQIFVSPTVANTNFTGNIVLNSGNLTLNTTAAVMSPGSTLEIFGGTVRGSSSFTLPNNVMLNSQLHQVGVIAATYNGLINGDGGIFINNSASITTTFNNTISGIGTITVQGFGTFVPTISLGSTSTTNGTAANALAYFANFGVINLTNTTATATRLNGASALFLNSGTLALTAGTAAPASEAVATTIVSGGGIIAVTPSTTQPAIFNGGTLTRIGNATMQFATTGTGLTLGGVPGAPGNATITFSNLTSGDNINGVLPWGSALIQNGAAASGTFVRYDNVNGIVPLNLTSDYVQHNTLVPVAVGSQPTSNYRIASTSGNMGPQAYSMTLNSMLIETPSGAALGNGGLYGPGTINLTSGVLGLSLSGGTTSPTHLGTIIQKNIAFGAVPGSLQVQTSNSVLLGNMTGGAGLVKGGSGQIWLLGNNSGLTGGLTVNGAAILFSKDTALGAPGDPITIGSSTNSLSQLQFIQNSIFEAPTLGSLTITRPLTIANNGAAQLASNVINTTFNYDGVISGNGRLVKSFIGVVSLGGANLYTGDTVISQGTLNVNADANLGNSSSNIVLNSTSSTIGFQGLLMISSSFISSRNILVTSTTALANGIFVNGGGTTFTLNGHIGGSQTGTPFAVFGAGELVLTANNTINLGITLGDATPSHRFGTPFAQPGGTVTLTGVAGAFSGVTAAGVGLLLNNGATLHLDNSGTPNFNRVASMQASLVGAELKLTGNSATSVIEHIGLSNTLGIANTSGGNTITLVQPGSGGPGMVTTLVSTSYTTGSGIAFFRGDNLGGASGDRTAMIFVAAPTLTNGLLPQAVYGGLSLSSPEDFATTTPTGIGTSVSVQRFTAYTPLPATGGVATVTYDLNAPLIMTSSQAGNALKIVGSDLDLAGFTLTLGSATQAGMLLTTGAPSNIVTSAPGGTLAFGAAVARFITSGNLSVGSALSPVTISSTAGFRKSGPGVLDVSSAAITSGGYHLGGGVLRFLTMSYTSGQTFIMQPGTVLDLDGLGTPASPFGILALNGFGTVNIGIGAMATGAAAASFGGSIIGTGTLLNTGILNQTLNGNSPLFTGDVQILAGTLTVDADVVPSSIVSPGPLGIGTTPIQLGNSSGATDATLALGGTVTKFDRDIVVPAGSTGIITLTQVSAGIGAVSGDIELGRELRLNGAGSSTAHTSGAMTITGQISESGGTGSLDWFGGNYNLWGANTYSGRTLLNCYNKAVLGFGTDTAFGLGGPIQVDVSTSFVGYLRADNGARTIANPWLFDAGTITALGFGGQNDMTFTGAVNFTNGARTLEVTNTGNTTFAGVITESGGVASLIKTGSGLLTLGGANNFTGGVTINGGTIRATNLSGSATGSGAVIVNAGGRLEGTGTVAGNITVNAMGAIKGGSSVGTLTIGGDLTMASGSYIAVELAGIFAQGPISSGASTDGPLPNPTTNNYINKTGGAAPTTLNLATLLVDVGNIALVDGGNYSYVVGGGMGDQSALFVTAPGQFQFYNVTSGYTITNPSFTGDAGGLIFLNFSAIPEPGLLLGALGLLAVLRRRAVR